MTVQKIFIEQLFFQPLADVFNQLADHKRFGEIVGSDIERINDSKTEHINGVGSIRKIKIIGRLAFEETVTQFIPNQLIEYKVTKGSPIKNHRGRLEFSAIDNQCKLTYRIEFEPKVALPLWGTILKSSIQRPIERGLKSLGVET